LLAKLSYGPQYDLADQLKIGEAGGVTMEGAGSFDRAMRPASLTLMHRGVLRAIDGP